LSENFEPRTYTRYPFDTSDASRFRDVEANDLESRIDGAVGALEEADAAIWEALGNVGSGLDEDTMAALAGTNGTPSGTNMFVTDSDPRLSDAREPTEHSHQISDVDGLGDALSAKVDDSALSDHESATTSVHGITDTSDLVYDDDARLTDARTPIDGSVTAAKVHSSLKPSGSAAATDESLRRLGTGSTHAAAGDDSRFPTSGEKNALAGTAGTPGSDNKYVTNQDSRLSDAREPKAHSHEVSDVDGLSDALSGKADTGDGRFPSSGEKAALAGTAGSPGAGNKYVTDSDARLSNARTPTAHTHTQSDIDGLATALAGKANTTHHHLAGVEADWLSWDGDLEDSSFVIADPDTNQFVPMSGEDFASAVQAIAGGGGGDPWIYPTLGDSIGAFRYRKDADGWVEIQACISLDYTGAEVLSSPLPVGYRPLVNLTHQVTAANSLSGSTMPRAGIQILTDGTVTVFRHTSIPDAPPLFSMTVNYGPFDA